MWQADAASRWFGMEIVETGPGCATLRMTVADHHCNGHGTAHGGVIFALADSAFAFACNSYNRQTVAQHNTITYHAPGRAGDVLVAEATEVTRPGRSGLYDVAVRAGDTLIASFRGASREVPGQHFEETP